MVVKGHKKENRKADEEERKLVAYHEAGHALCAKLLTDNSVPNYNSFNFWIWRSNL